MLISTRHTHLHVEGNVARAYLNICFSRPPPGIAGTFNDDALKLDDNGDSTHFGVNVDRRSSLKMSTPAAPLDLSASANLMSCTARAGDWATA
jgi:hypothetical protein